MYFSWLALLQHGVNNKYDDDRGRDKSYSAADADKNGNHEKRDTNAIFSFQPRTSWKINFVQAIHFPCEMWWT